MTTAPIRVLIFGSCVSRDILNYQPDNGQLVLVDYYARSSIASLGGRSIHIPPEVQTIRSAFQRRMVERDFRKDFLGALCRLEFDLLLIDLIDERFHLYTEGQGTCTLSSELVGSGFQGHLNKGTKIYSSSQEFLHRWNTGWLTLMRELGRLGLVDRVRINKVFWASSTESGSNFEPHYSNEQINAANAFLESLYERISVDISSKQFLRVDRQLMTGGVAHRWGISPFHYVDAYYRSAIQQLAALSDSSSMLIHRQDEEPISATSSDYGAWKLPRYQYVASEEAVSCILDKDGIHHIPCQSSVIDLLVEGSERIKNTGGPLLVAFSGAVANRAGKKAPFFSGRGVARSLGLPLVAFSDPTLALDGDIPLGWYAGNQALPNLPHYIAKILLGIKKRYQARLILFGGSGAGFAVLSQLSILQCDVTGFVWNPQTSISEYVPEVVRNYISIAFPKLREEVNGIKLLNKARAGEVLKQLLDRAHISHDMIAAPAPQGSLLYIQNQGDWHLGRHATPYLGRGKWSRLSARAFAEAGGRSACWFGNWGDGHAVPPQRLIETILSKLAAGRAVTQIASELDDQFTENDIPFSWFDADDATESPAVEVQVHNRQVSASCIHKGTDIDSCNVEYAFYLRADSVTKQVRWYQRKPNVTFDLPDSERNLTIVAFMKDSFGQIKTAVAPVF